MIPVLLALSVGAASAPVQVELDPCVSQWVATTSVAALLEVELSPRSLEVGPEAEVHLGCAAGLAEITAAGRRWTLPISEVPLQDRARDLALAMAEELRMEGPGAPRLEARSTPDPATTTGVDVTRARAGGWSLLTNSTLLKPVGDSGIAGTLQASALLRDGLLRPRIGIGIWAGADGDPVYYGAFVITGADLALYRDRDWRLGLQATAAGGAFLELRDPRLTSTEPSGNAGDTTQSRLGPFGLLTAGLFLERSLGETGALNLELGAGTFLPTLPTAAFSVGLRVDP